MASCVPGCKDSLVNPAPHVVPEDEGSGETGRRHSCPPPAPSSLQGLLVPLPLGKGCGFCLGDLSLSALRHVLLH